MVQETPQIGVVEIVGQQVPPSEKKDGERTPNAHDQSLRPHVQHGTSARSIWVHPWRKCRHPTTMGHEIGAGRVWQGVARAWLLKSLPLSERSTRWAEDTKEFLLNRRIRYYERIHRASHSQLGAIRGEKEDRRRGDGTGNQIRHQGRAHAWSGHTLDRHSITCSARPPKRPCSAY